MKTTRNFKAFMLAMLATIGLSMAGCSGDPDMPINKGDADLNITPAELNFSEEGGEKTLEVKSTGAWTLEIPANGEWVAVTPSSGDGNTAVVVKAVKNDAEERALNLTFKSGDKTVQIPVKQDGKKIETTPYATIIKEGEKLDKSNDSREITENWVIKGVVTNDATNGHNTPFGAKGYYFIQSGEEALILTLPKGSDGMLNQGDHLTVKLKGGKLTNFRGYGSIQVTPKDFSMISAVVGEKVTPKELTVEQLNEALKAGKLDNVLVKVTGVQFTDDYAKDGKKMYEGDRTYRPELTNKAGEIVKLAIYAKAKDVFASVDVPKGSGYVVGIANKFGENGPHTIVPSVMGDIVLDQDRFAVGGTTPDPKPDPKPDPTPGDAKLLFPGSDFENWELFLDGLNKYKVKDYVTQSNDGREGSKALLVKTDGASKNDYLFTAQVPEEGGLAGKSKVYFYIKGTVDGKSISVNVYQNEKNDKGRQQYKAFNLGDVSDKALTISEVGPPPYGNDYKGTIDTKGAWVKITLDLSVVSDIATEGDMFAIKIGKEVAAELLIDDIMVE